MRRAGRWAVLLSLVTRNAQAAGTRPVVVVCETSDVEDAAFVDALRIQLNDGADIEVHLEPLPADAAARAQEAAARLDRDRRILALVEDASRRSATARSILAVSTDAAGALDERSFDAAPGPEGDRALALQVGEWLVHVIRTHASAVPLPPSADARASSSHAERRAAVAPLDAGATALVVAAGGVVRGDASFTQVGAVAGVAGRARWRTTDAAILVSYGLFLPARAASTAGEVRLDEQDAAVHAMALWRIGSWSFGPEAGALLRFARAGGTSADGQLHGSRDRAIAATSWAIALGWEPLSAVTLRAAAGIEVPFDRQVFTLHGVPGADLGRVQPFVGLSLMYALVR